MNTNAALDWEQLTGLFTVVLALDDRGRVLRASDTALRHAPELGPGVSFFDFFVLLRPAGTTDIAGLRKHLHSLFLMKTLDERFAVRGQMLDLFLDGEPRLCFCGSPWLFWMNANCPDVKLGMGDFSPQDSQLDQLFLMTTEQRMVADLEKLNSELKNAKQETEAAQKTKNALFARMSHEMRTPLNGVVSALSLLADKELPSEARKLLGLAHSSSRNLLHVINYVLDISKMESGEDTLDKTVFALPRLLKSVTDIIRARAVEKNLELVWRTSPQLGQMYAADKAKLRQCLLNLVTNAIKFTDAGSVVIRAVPSALGVEGQVRFEVEDTGRGISEEHQEKIFEPFWTDAEPSTGEEAGTGLGLDIVRRYVNLMHGEVGVISKLGRGSLFWFEIPLEASDQETALNDAEHSIGAQVPDRFDGRVLLVDDNATNRMLGRMILESLGLVIDEANDGGEAVEKSLAEPFDLVLMDISMPVLDGVDATKKIRKRLGPAELPIVALTAYASTEEKERCLHAGMNDYLTKPIVRDRLAEQLNRFLNRRPEIDGADIDGGEDLGDEVDPPLVKEVLNDLREQIGDANLGTVLDQFEGEVRIR
ncbi:MAG: ATP-binding protein, partial [Pseudomonadota bacterium]